MKRSPLKRGSSQLKRTPLARSASTLKRTRLNPQSDKQRQRVADRRDTSETVKQRDGHCRLRDMLVGHQCFGGFSPHHLLRQSQGHDDDEDNIVWLCAAANSWVENEPLLAHKLGLVIRAEDL